MNQVSLIDMQQSQAKCWSVLFSNTKKQKQKNIQVSMKQSLNQHIKKV